MPPTGPSPNEIVRGLFLRALAGVAPAGPTERALADLDLADSIVLLATGKAALGMAAGADAALGPRIAERVVVVPRRPGQTGSRQPAMEAASLWEGAHPVPDARSEAAGRALLAAAARSRPGQEIVALISGGGSALTAVPAPGLCLADKAEAIARLMAAGAPIAELNCVRRHLSAFKGGRLARASAARVTTLVVSDVVGDRLADVASGPTVPDPTSFADACDVIERRLGWDVVPEAAARRLRDGRRGLVPEGLAGMRPGDRAFLLLGLGALVEAAAEEARRDPALIGPIEVLPERLEGDVSAVAARLARYIADRDAGLLIAGGEPTVSLPRRPGRSGRAQHLALLLARALAEGGQLAGRDVAFLVAGSDGVDGVSQAAGAIVERDTWERIRAAGLDPEAHVAACDAAAALAAVGAQLVTGPTGVNHADLILAYCAGRTGRD